MNSLARHIETDAHNLSVPGLAAPQSTIPDEVDLGALRHPGRNRAAPLLQHDASAIAFGLEGIGTGTFLLDDKGRLLFANAVGTTLIEDADGIFLDNQGYLRCCEQTVQTHLSAIFANTKTSRRRTSGQSMRLLVIPRPVGWPLAALIGRQVDIDQANGSPRADGSGRVVMFVRDPEREVDDTAHRVAELFGLSRAEAQVVARLAAGDSLPDIAKDRGVSLITIRNQVKAAQSKLGVSRQTEMISLILRAVQF